MSESSNGVRLRAVAAEIVDAVVTKGRSLDALIQQQEVQLPTGDRPVLRLLCFGALRYHWRLKSWIEGLLDRPLRPRDSVINALLAIGLYQLSDTRIPDHAVVSQTVEAARLLHRPKLAALVNALLRRARRDRIFAAEPSNEEARFNHPTWLIDYLRADWPEDFAAILDANNDRAPMWLRVNAREQSAAQYLDTLRDAGVDGELLAAAPQAIRLNQALPAEQLPGFDEGKVSVQDAAAQLAAPWLLTGSRGRVLDACAAPGGKSAHLLELGGEQIELTCLDSDPARLASLSGNLERLGLDATRLQGDASTPQEWWDGRAYAAILLDAPCSASGVIRRHPDIKLLRRETDIPALARTQAGLLDSLWPLLAAGGRLLYVTCSVLAAENDAVVRNFLEKTTDAKQNDVLQDNNIRDLMRPKACGYQVLPGTAGLDGFYFACLEKES